MYNKLVTWNQDLLFVLYKIVTVLWCAITVNCAFLKKVLLFLARRRVLEKASKVLKVMDIVRQLPLLVDCLAGLADRFRHGRWSAAEDTDFADLE